MAGGTRHDTDDVIADINVTPFVDIVLVLLIIFMVTSTYIVRAAIRVELPKAASGGEEVETTLNIVLTDTGALMLNGEPTTPAQLAAHVKSETARTPKLQAVIAADQRVDYGAVMEVIDLVKLNGIKSFALNVERKTPTTASAP